MIGIQRKIEVNSENQGVFVNYLIHYCLDIKLCSGETASPAGICLECLDRLKFIYNFKELCKRNHDQYFSNLQLNETNQELTASIIKEEPICMTHSVIKKQDDFELLQELKPDITARDRREEENRKNAQRQRDKRRNESLEERLLRTKRAAEQARKRRQKLRKENPEEYRKRLARAAELKRIRRSGLSYEEQKFEELNAALKESDQLIDSLTVHDENNDLKDKIDKQDSGRLRLSKNQQNYELQPIKEEGSAGNFVCYNNSESIGSWQSESMYSES